MEVKVKVNEFFGDSELSLEFPKNWGIEVITMAGHDAPQLTDDQIRDAFSHPIGTQTIEEMAKGKRGRVVVTCDDLTRPTPAHRVFPFIMEELQNAGISDDQIFILGSFGAHPTMNLDDFTRKVGDEMVAKYPCVNHNCYDHLENIGISELGTPVNINKEFYEADLRISVSGIKKHGMAGSGGGGKAVLPGVTSLETILWNHHAVRGSQPNKIWFLKDNLMRQDMQQIARMAELNLSINCNYNGKRELVGLHIGDVDDAWKEAVKQCYQLHATPPVKEKADIVIACSYPKSAQGTDFWCANASLKEGGTAVGIHHYPPGRSIVHYRSEYIGRNWQRIKGSTPKRWPVENAEHTIMFTDRLQKSYMLGFKENVEWTTSWRQTIKRLRDIHEDEARVAIYPCSALQFETKENPLLL